jgi:hypothetical protein
VFFSKSTRQIPFISFNHGWCLHNPTRKTLLLPFCCMSWKVKSHAWSNHISLLNYVLLGTATEVTTTILWSKRGHQYKVNSSCIVPSFWMALLEFITEERNLNIRDSLFSKVFETCSWELYFNTLAIHTSINAFYHFHCDLGSSCSSAWVRGAWREDATIVSSSVA